MRELDTEATSDTSSDYFSCTLSIYYPSLMTQNNTCLTGEVDGKGSFNHYEAVPCNIGI
jgi:hypothetical protein